MNWNKIVLPLAFGVLISGFVVLSSCGGDGPVLLSIENDKELGAQVSEQIANDSTFTILSEDDYPEAYAYLNAMKEDILNSSEIQYKNEFVWQLHIIDDDVLNAFATPGGYIYVYTGLIKYLDNADDLAGVMGHELAHADRRHSMKQLQRNYGVSLILSILLGQDPTVLQQITAQIAGTLTGLSFSRTAESEADEYSVKYLAETDYACNGAAAFFAKLIKQEQTGSTPEFLSTHPSPDNRVEDINKEADKIGCDTGLISESNYTYEDFQNDLP